MVRLDFKILNLGYARLSILNPNPIQPDRRSLLVNGIGVNEEEAIDVVNGGVINEEKTNVDVNGGGVNEEEANVAVNGGVVNEEEANAVVNGGGVNEEEVNVGADFGVTNEVEGVVMFFRRCKIQKTWLMVMLNLVMNLVFFQVMMNLMNWMRVRMKDPEMMMIVLGCKILHAGIFLKF